jgi:hypothetical protein
VSDVREGPIAIRWTGPRSFEVHAGDLEWRIELGSTAATRAMNIVASALPERAWRSERLLDVMARVAGPALRAGRVRLSGTAPNGQRFGANPLRMWVASASSAAVAGTDLGAMGPAPEQAFLGDFAIPQRGMFVVGRAYFRS